MKALALWFSLAAWSRPAQAETVSPIAKVQQLLTDLQAKLVAEGKEAQKLYDEFAEFCETRSKDLQFEIKESTAQKNELEAVVDKQAALIESYGAKIEELSESVSTDEKSLKDATAVRKKEHKDFSAEEKELTGVADTLERAVSVLEKKMRNGGASMVQLDNVNSLAEALGTMVQAAGISVRDGQKLTALVQSMQQESGEETGAPTAASYEGHGSEIVETMENLLEKAQTRLAELRKAETEAAHNFELLKSSLDREVADAQEDMDAAKKGLAVSSEKKAAANGDLTVTTKDLEVDKTAITDLHQECMAKATDFETGTQSRADEFKAITEAKKVIVEATGGADKLQYGSESLLEDSSDDSGTELSFLQERQRSSDSRLRVAKSMRMVRALARSQRSPLLAQLASRIGLEARSSIKAGKDPFEKVIKLVYDMLSKLRDQMEEEATSKAHCDEETKETNEKIEDKSTEMEKLVTQIDQMTVRSAQLKEQVSELQRALSSLSSSQAELDKLRHVEHADYETQKKELDEGLEGVKTALKVLRDYYSKQEGGGSGGAGSSIIGLLEVIESDLSKSIAGLVATEESALTAYETETDENQEETAAKSKDVKLKTAAAADLDKTVSEATSDKSRVQSELDAVNDYLKSLNKQCIAQPSSYEERRERRKAEIAGLKSALKTLQDEGDEALMQMDTAHSRRQTRRHLRYLSH